MGRSRSRKQTDKKDPMRYFMMAGVGVIGVLLCIVAVKLAKAGRGQPGDRGAGKRIRGAF